MTRYWIPAENNAVEWTTCVHENAIPISPSTPREPCRLVNLDLDGVYGDNGGMVWFGGCVVDWLPWKQGRDSGDRGHKVKDDEDGHLIYQEGDLLQARCTCHFVMFSLGLFFPWDQNFVPCFFALSFLFLFLIILILTNFFSFYISKEWSMFSTDEIMPHCIHVAWYNLGQFCFDETLNKDYFSSHLLLKHIFAYVKQAEWYNVL